MTAMPQQSVNLGKHAFSNLCMRGEAARKWRRKIGTLADSVEEKDTRTRKFPLELPGEKTSVDFDRARELFNVVEGTAAGSLAAFLCATHLSGFRVFGGGKMAKEHRSTMEQGPTIAQDDKRRLRNLQENNADIFLHQAIAVIARQVRDEGKAEVKKNDIKLHLFGGAESTPHGLSWLFGVGWKWLIASDISDEEIARRMDADIKRVRQLRKYARLIPQPSFYNKAHYSDFRVQVAQKLGSWVGNYWKRLDELHNKVEKPPKIKLPSSLDDEKLSQLLPGAHITQKKLTEIAGALRKKFQDARGALKALYGYGNGVPQRKDIDKFDELNAAVDELAGYFRRLSNAAGQRSEDDKNADFKKLGEELEQAIKPLAKLEKLNRISGGAPDAKEQTRATAAAFNALWQHCQQRLSAISQDIAGMEAVWKVLAANEAKKLKDKKKQDEPATPQELAVRKLLQQIGNSARNMRLQNMEIIAAALRSLFVNKKDANRYFNNRLGSLYRSPFSRSRHNAYALDWRKAEKTDWIQEMEKAAGSIEAGLGKGRAEDWRDWLECRMLAMFIRLQGLPEELPGGKVSALADIPDDAAEHLHFSPVLRDALRSDFVSRGDVISGFNQLRSALRGLAYKVMRPNFVVRTVFHPYGQDELIYAPKSTSALKNGKWIPPQRHLTRYAKTFAAMEPARMEEDGAFNPTKAVDALLRARRGKDRGNAPLTDEDRTALTQTPHDWYFPLKNWDFADDATRIQGMTIKKSIAAQKKGFNMLSQSSALRMIGPSSLKGALEDCLRGRVVLGESNLIVECQYTQEFIWQDKKLSLAVAPSSLRAELAVPVVSETKAAPKKNSPFYDRFVAIDLGMRGIGFTLFSIREWQKNGCINPITENDRCINGNIPIPSIRGLIRAVHHHRAAAQPGQKIQDSYSRALEKQRKNVIGDVCHAIDSLCAQYNAFPVLEGDVSNLESGVSQLKLVYGSVVHRYTYSSTDAHKKQRGDHWFTGKNGGVWPHPYLKRQTKEKIKELKLFPGTGVSAAGTSQLCSVCKRNALKMLRDLPDNTSLHFDNGKADLPKGKNEKSGGSLFLYERTTKPEDKRKLRELNRRKERPQLNKPLNGAKKVSELRALVKFNMRRHPVSTRSRDTSQSRYFCVFADCRAQMHADENAAINIGRRFLSDLER